LGRFYFQKLSIIILFYLALSFSSFTVLWSQEFPAETQDLVQPVIDSATEQNPSSSIESYEQPVVPLEDYGQKALNENPVVLVRDEAGLFDATIHSEIRLQLLSLKRETSVDLFLVTKIVPSLDEVEVIAYDLFRSLVREEGHYKVILVLVAISPQSGQGTVSTNLGAGVYHLLEKKDCEGLFIRKGEPFSPEGVKQGIVFLKEKIQSAFARGRRADVVAGSEDDSLTDSIFGNFGWSVLAVFVLLLGVIISYVASRPPKCPRCGEKLKTKVNVVVGTGGSDIARKTFKCFKCGYVKRKSLIPSVFIRNKE
jgi:hypothetical protein